MIKMKQTDTNLIKLYSSVRPPLVWDRKESCEEGKHRGKVSFPGGSSLEVLLECAQLLRMLLACSLSRL